MLMATVIPVESIARGVLPTEDLLSDSRTSLDLGDFPVNKARSRKEIKACLMHTSPSHCYGMIITADVAILRWRLIGFLAQRCPGWDGCIRVKPPGIWKTERLSRFRVPKQACFRDG